MKPRIWYHVTWKDLGDFVVLEPRNPGIPGEPDIPRICVAPNVRCCLAAVGFIIETMHVYVTTEPISAHMPHGVDDFRRTHERWLFSPMVFVKLRTVKVTHGRGCFAPDWQIDFKRKYRP
jgi:hypothetical protein